MCIHDARRRNWSCWHASLCRGQRRLWRWIGPRPGVPAVPSRPSVPSPAAQCVERLYLDRQTSTPGLLPNILCGKAGLVTTIFFHDEA